MLRIFPFVLCAAAFAAEPSVTLPPALDRVLRDYERHWTAKNAKELAALFAEDGFVMAGGRDMVRGRAAIEQHYTGQGGPLFLRAVAFSINGDTGYILGGYTDQSGAPDRGKFTLTLKRVKGKWMIFSDMDNGNQPARR